MADFSSSFIETECANTQNKQPLQTRSQQRMNQVLLTAERMIIELGPENVSIPDVATQSGVPRSSIYQFFPSKYALLTHIAHQHLIKIANNISLIGQTLAGQQPFKQGENNSASNATTVKLFNWQKRVAALITIVADYYNQAPAASILILGGPFSRSAYFEHEAVLMQIGATLRSRLANYAIDIDLPVKPDTITIAVEIAFACMKHGYYRDNQISTATCNEATRAVTGYLSTYTKIAVTPKETSSP